MNRFLLVIDKNYGVTVLTRRGYLKSFVAVVIRSVDSAETEMNISLEVAKKLVGNRIWLGVEAKEED